MSNMAGVNRGFVLNAQRVALDLDFAGSVKATTYLTVKPTNVRLSTVFLHAAPCLKITAVHLSGPNIDDPLPSIPASFTHYNPLLGLSDSSDGQTVNFNTNDAIQRHPDIKRRLWSAMTEKDEGELAIDVSHGWVRIAQTKDGSVSQTGLADILIQIDYEINMCEVDTEGIVWRRPGDAGNNFRIPHMFVNSSAHDSARHWLPCLDNLWDRCPWELEIAVPRYLKQEAESADEGIERGPDDIMIEDGEIVRVVASAELEEQVIHPEDPKKTIFYFVQSNPTSAQQMSFAAGPFHIHVIPEEDQTRRLLDSLDPTSDVQPLLLAYCLPGFELDLANSVSCMRQAMSFFEGYDGYPYSSFKMVFVEDPSSQSSTSASMTTFSQELLYPPEVLEQALITRPILTGSLAAQWSGVHMVPRSYSDIWLTLGLSLYINAQFTRHLLGNNDYRDRLRSDMDRCIALDKGEQYPLYVPGAIALPDLDALQFIALKAPLILHMLDIRMARLATSSGLARNVIPDIFRQARGGTLPDRALSTENFFRICRKVSKSLDLAAFQEQWVTGSGCPKFVIGAQYNKKGQSITVSVFQGPSQAWSTVSRVEPQSLEWKSPTKHFSGEITLWVHEGDGAPYEHVVEVGDEGLTHELVYNPHQRRAHRLRNGQYRQDKGLPALQAADEAPPLSAEVLDAMQSDKDWRFSGWNEPDAITFVDQGFDWIRYDPECEWLASIEVLSEVSAGIKAGLAPVQMTYFWTSQLLGDRDVAAQKEAITHLAQVPSELTATTLTKVALDDTCYYKVRMFAIEALPRMIISLETGEKLGIFHLIKILQTRYCSFSQRSNVYTLRSPLQRHLADYMIQQTLIRVLSVWPWNASIPKEVEFSCWLRNALTMSIEEGDTEANAFSQSFYLASLITNLATLQKRVGIQARQAEDFLRTAESIDRTMALDKVLPSYGNIITLAGIQAKFALALTDKQVMPVHVPFFLSYTRIGNLPAVRRLAMDCVLACQIPPNWLYKHLRYLLRTEQSLSFRRHIAEGLTGSWLMGLALGEVEGIHVPQSRYTETVEGRAIREKDELEKDVPAWRRRLNQFADAGKLLMSHILDTGLDNELRVGFLQAAEILTPGRREGAAAKLILKLGSGSKIRPKSTTRAGPALPSEPVQQQKKRPKGRQYRGGLSEEDFKAVNITLEKLLIHPRSDFFRYPVPDDQNFAPGYYKIIKRPIDLSAIKHKLMDGQYENRHQFREDLELIVSNCKAYNGENSIVYNAAVEFEKVFRNQWSKVEKTLFKKAQVDTVNASPVPPATLKLNVKRPSVSSGVGEVRDSVPVAEQAPVSVRMKDFAQPSLVVKPKLIVKPNVVRLPKPVKDDVGSEIMEALGTTESRPVPKVKKVKIAGNGEVQSNPVVSKLKMNNGPKNGTTASAVQIQAPSLKRKIDNVTAPPVAPTPQRSEAEPLAPLPHQIAQPPENVKRLTERGWTVDSTPFKRVRALKLLKDLSGQFFVLFGPRPDEKLAAGYYTEIKSPMYFALIETKIEKGQYRTLGEFAADLEQIIWNCRRYNGFAHEPESQFAKPMEQQLLRLWPRTMLADAITTDEKRILDQWINFTLKTQGGSWFADPVDPVALKLPDYFNVVRPQDARDLTMIKNRLKILPSLSTIDNDVVLMVDNAVKYNGLESPVGQAAKAIEYGYDKKRKEIQPHGSARGSVENRAPKRPRHE